MPTVAGDLAARTGQAAQAYALGCCALDVAEDQTCVVTDHRLLPLSWTRDAYFVVLPLLLHGEPHSVEEDVAPTPSELALRAGPRRRAVDA